MNATHATPHAAPATCRIDGCTAQPCEPGSPDNRWARNLCAVHVDAAFQCGGCDRWLPDTEYASGPTVGEEPICDDCYKSGDFYVDPLADQRQEWDRQAALAHSFKGA